MPITNLFFYKILFIAEILAAEFIYTFRLKKKPRFALRFSACCALLLAAAALFPIFVNTFWYSSFMFLALFSLTVPALRFCFDEPLSNVFFCAMAAYTTQHFAYELANLALSLINEGKSPLLGMYDNEAVDFWAFDKESVFLMLAYVICYVASYYAMYLCFARRIQKGRDMKIKNLSLLLLIAAGLLVDIVLNSAFTYNENSDFIGGIVNYITNMLCCSLLLYCQFSLLLAKEMRYELAFVNRMWSQEKEQYVISKELIDLINMKCHDMRHQIREIGRSNSFSDDTIREMEGAISMYDSLVKTGSEVLDIILTEKAMRCRTNGIRFTCLADGAALAFMVPSDLYSLFGNALENAVDAVKKIEDADSRVIALKIHTVGELVTVNLKNPYAGELKFDGRGLPETTKGDTDYHGYGVKSIAYIVEKYGGNLSIVAKDGIFNLNILIPVPKTQNAE